MLYCDMSDFSIGYILGQKDTEGRLQVIAYGGRAIYRQEKKWKITDREELALVDGIQHYRIYLEHGKFLVYTDHQVVGYKDTNDPTGKLASWAIKLQEYDLDVLSTDGKILQPTNTG